MRPLKSLAFFFYAKFGGTGGLKSVSFIAGLIAFSAIIDSGCKHAHLRKSFGSILDGFFSPPPASFVLAAFLSFFAIAVFGYLLLKKACVVFINENRFKEKKAPSKKVPSPKTIEPCQEKHLSQAPIDEEEPLEDPLKGLSFEKEPAQEDFASFEPLEEEAMECASLGDQKGPGGPARLSTLKAEKVPEEGGPKIPFLPKKKPPPHIEDPFSGLIDVIREKG